MIFTPAILFAAAIGGIALNDPWLMCIALVGGLLLLALYAWDHHHGR